MTEYGQTPDVITICESMDGNLCKINYYREDVVNGFINRVIAAAKDVENKCSKRLAGYDEGDAD